MQPPRLPDPSTEAKEISRQLSDAIRRLIARQGGWIGFDDYMRVALYEPGLGYYVGGAAIFGADGDFVTAPEISPLYGACIARQCEQVLAERSASIIEFGGGTGRLAGAILSALERNGSLPETYSIVELSPLLRAQQARNVARACPAAAGLVRWLEAPPAGPFDGIVIANEILDAIPAKRFKIEHGSIFELGVGDNGPQLCWAEKRADDALTVLVRDRVSADVLGGGMTYVSEICPNTDAFIAEVAGFLRSGLIVLADYGYERGEYYRRHRDAGTLLCHYRHQAHGDPFWFPGLQDISVAVEFTAVAEAAANAGLDVLGYAEQSSFLLSCGLLDRLGEATSGSNENAKLQLNQQVKQLTLPTAMGTRCKIMVLGRGVEGPLVGYALRNDLQRL